MNLSGVRKRSGCGFRCGILGVGFYGHLREDICECLIHNAFLLYMYINSLKLVVTLYLYYYVNFVLFFICLSIDMISHLFTHDFITCFFKAPGTKDVKTEWKRFFCEIAVVLLTDTCSLEMHVYGKITDDWFTNRSHENITGVMKSRMSVCRALLPQASHSRSHWTFLVSSFMSHRTSRVRVKYSRQQTCLDFIRPNLMKISDWCRRRSL